MFTLAFDEQLNVSQPALVAVYAVREQKPGGS